MKINRAIIRILSVMLAVLCGIAFPAYAKGSGTTKLKTGGTSDLAAVYTATLWKIPVDVNVNLNNSNFFVKDLLEDAEVSLKDLRGEDVTSQGNHAYLLTEAGTYTYTVSAEGYNKKTGTITAAEAVVSGGEKIKESVSLTREKQRPSLSTPSGSRPSP